MKTRTPTPTPAILRDSTRNFDSAYIEARMREARCARSEALWQIMTDSRQALVRLAGRFVRSLTATSKQPVLRH